MHVVSDIQPILMHNFLEPFQIFTAQPQELFVLKSIKGYNLGKLGGSHIDGEQWGGDAICLVSTPGEAIAWLT